MEVMDAIRARRSYRSLAPAEAGPGLADDLAMAASLAPSCFNRQPWRFVFASGDALEGVFASLSRGNEWFRAASMVAGVYTKRDLDCVAGRREYYLFDTGMAVGMMLLRATELGLVAHPIAGFDEEAASRALRLPEDALLVTLIALGRRTDLISPVLSGHQIEAERERPPRLPLDEIRTLLDSPA